MMGYQPPPQRSLFYTGFNLDKRIRRNHPLRKVRESIDFDFLYKEVEDKYGSNGNVSVAPPVILKLMLLLVFYNVRSERELMDTLPERLDWLWFVDYDLDSEIPNHSVLSKARKKWGVEAFQRFFERIVWQCVEAGLVDGSKIFMDSSLIDADASNNSVVDTHSLKRHLKKSYRELERRLEEEGSGVESSAGGVNERYRSTTDPDASVVNRGGKPKLQYQTHRAVDPAYEIITATEVTPGDVNEAHRMIPLLERHQETTGRQAETVVADSKYGTIENYVACYDRGVKAHIPDLKKHQENKGARKGIFSEDRFTYNPGTDTYRCPSGKILKRKSLHKNRQSIDYAAPRKTCLRCELRSLCTRNKSGRTIKRHLRQEALDQMRPLSCTAVSRRDIETRKHLMERTFAVGTRYGFDRARWRRLWRVSIQEYLTSTIQNIQILIKHGKGSGKHAAIQRSTARWVRSRLLLSDPFVILQVCYLNFSTIIR
jgi:transposase